MSTYIYLKVWTRMLLATLLIRISRGKTQPQVLQRESGIWAWYHISAILSFWEADAGGFQVWGQLKSHSKTLSQTDRQKGRGKRGKLATLNVDGHGATGLSLILKLQYCCSPLGDSLMVSHEIKHTLSALAVLCVYPKELKMYVHTVTCPWMFLATLFILAETWKQPRCPLVCKWTNTLLHPDSRGFKGSILPSCPD